MNGKLYSDEKRLKSDTLLKLFKISEKFSSDY